MTEAEERALRAQYARRAALLRERARSLAADVRDLLRDVAQSRVPGDRGTIHDAAVAADTCADRLGEVLSSR